ncbi:type IX secretion system sortase PorU [Prolixibacter sp. SD074]|uniref:type IX secretion system sortase PorU n=1 Tax=Prolixibacter sp. SD074 TaxID=2652391 RepID=UPI0012993165|nr:type IX secretion system sortase PorU [Prolixibacter sp. SD074]
MIFCFSVSLEFRERNNTISICSSTMYKLFFFISIFLFGGNLYGEQLTVSLTWHKADNSALPVFTGAKFDDVQPDIPFWSAMIPVNSVNVDAGLVVDQWNSLPDTGAVEEYAFPDTLTFTGKVVIAAGTKFLQLRLSPFVRESGNVRYVSRFHVRYSVLPTLKTASLVGRVATHSVLASGTWKKVKVTGQGMHCITYADLTDMGFQTPANLRIYGNLEYMLDRVNRPDSPDDLVPIPFYTGKNASGDDCLFFYAPGTVKWTYDETTGMYQHQLNSFAPDYSFFYLTENSSIAPQVPTEAIAGSTADAIVTQYDYHDFSEKEENNLIESGRQWFGPALTGSASQSVAFSVPNRVVSEPVSFQMEAAARTKSGSSLSVKTNGTILSDFQFSAYQTYESADYADLQEKQFAYSGAGTQLNVVLQSNAGGTDQTWLDYIRMQARASLILSGNELIFRDSRSVKPGRTARFSLSGANSQTRIWDVTSPLSPRAMQTTLDGSKLNFLASVDSLHEFIAFNPSANYPGVEFVEDIANQDLHGIDAGQMLIITPEIFLAQANELANFHRQKDGLNVSVVPVEKIYNEFSMGIKDVTAIRNFIRMCYRKNSGNSLKYVLLFGKGTYDNIHDVPDENPDYIPTWQSENSVNPSLSFVSDDYFGLLDDGEGEYNGAVDVGVGRIPCLSQAEAASAVEKIIHYASGASLGEWRNVLCFIADDEDGNLHMRDAERLADQVNSNYPSFYTDKIYFDAYPQETTPDERYPEVTTAINDRIKRGVLIMNYTGHANEEGLAHEKVLMKPDIDAWTNYDKLPVFVTATCEFSRWDYTNKQSAGEHVLFNPNGGGVALFSTTRLVYSSANYQINKSFFNHVFEQDQNGENLRMGDVIRLSKIDNGGTINSRKFALLGDPALRLTYPQYHVATLKINGQQADTLRDTIHALDVIKVSGQVQDIKADKLTNFNGDLYPIVYDKQTTEQTLGNAGQAPFDYVVQNNVLYKGKVSVTNGVFSFSFVVPKDINYRVDKGTIRYYATDGKVDGQGYYNQFDIGGASSGSTNDVTGPDIQIYLDNEKFRSGDETGKNPLLLLSLADETGVNTSGTGIGHDLTATLDGNEQNLIVFNDLFQADLNSYNSGTVNYQFNNLSDGIHTLKIKAWDVLNNSSEKEVVFNVNTGLKISRVYNYPNPVTDETHFVFEHNQYGELFDVTISIYDLQGRLADRMDKSVLSDGLSSNPVTWNPASRGIYLPKGIYVYRITATSSEGFSASGSGQMLILY